MRPESRSLTLLLASLATPSLLAQTINVSTLPRLGSVSPRFQSYNVEMVEVTGGRFWAPYRQHGQAQPDDASKASVPSGMDPSLYRYHPPINLYNPKLRKLAAALGPAYVRVSGTWANSTYFHDSDSSAPEKPPTGFGSVLTRKQWKGVLDFSRAVDAELVTSFAVSTGVRDANGVWTPVEAKKVLAFTRANGGSIGAAEMFNEPTFASISNVPKNYDAQAYGRDFKAFHAFISKAAPKMTILGPGSVYELAPPPSGISMLKTIDLLNAAGTDGLDAFSYHFYGGPSRRCQQLSEPSKDNIDTALTDDWLSRTLRDEEFYSKLRDQYLPGKPLWLTETGEAACGGDPWAPTFIDTFRYLNQLGSLARRSVKVVIHNTLASSDYALLDDDTFDPRPNYWAALLWRRFMGTTVLDAGVAQPPVYLYAHCLRNHPGVALLAINADRNAPHEISLPTASERYVLASDNLTSTQISLNGVDLMLDNHGNLPTLTGTPTPAGPITLAPATIAFFAIDRANNPVCRR